MRCFWPRRSIRASRSNRLTELWLENADVDELLDPDAHLWTRCDQVLGAAGGAIPAHPARQRACRKASRRKHGARCARKLARFVRSRWFAPPFSGIGFSGLIADALQAMRATPAKRPAAPGRAIRSTCSSRPPISAAIIELLRLNSPPVVQESEHRLPIGFRAKVPLEPGRALADPLELVFAARSTASFPGAFPPMKIARDRRAGRAAQAGMAGSRGIPRARHARPCAADRMLENVSLIDGSVLVNAPFSAAIDALKGRPAQREVDRRFVYIDPRPDRRGAWPARAEWRGRVSSGRSSARFRPSRANSRSATIWR